MSEKQMVTVDVRKLGLGMSHAFQGMAEVCASLGVPQEDMLGAVDEAEKGNAGGGGGGNRRTTDSVSTAGNNTTHTDMKEGSKSANKTQRPATGADAAVDHDTADAADSQGVKSESANGTVASNNSSATADDIARVLTAKVQKKMIKAADARALLEKYGAKSVSSLEPKYYDAVLEEASSM